MSASIETERLLLRPHRLDDFEPWYAMFTDPEVLSHLAVAAPSREDAWNRLLRYAGHWALLGYGLFAVRERASGAFVGDVGFADFHRDLGPRFDTVPEASWILAREAQGRGYASEAVDAAHAWIEASPRAGRTVCIVHPANTASLRLAARQGYRPYDARTYKGAPFTLLERGGAPSAAAG